MLLECLEIYRDDDYGNEKPYDGEVYETTIMNASFPARRSLSASALGGSAEAEVEAAVAGAAADFFFFLAISV